MTDGSAICSIALEAKIIGPLNQEFADFKASGGFELSNNLKGGAFALGTLDKKISVGENSTRIVYGNPLEFCELAYIDYATGKDLFGNNQHGDSLWSKGDSKIVEVIADFYNKDPFYQNITKNCQHFVVEVTSAVFKVNAHLIPFSQESDNVRDNQYTG